MLARSALSMPLWAAQLLTGAKSFADNRLIGSPKLNRLGLHATRLSLAHRLATLRRRRLAHLITPDDRAAFERDGFIVKPNLLPPAEFEALIEEIRAYRGKARETVQGDTVTRRIAIDPTLLRRLPRLERLIQSGQLQGIVRYVGSFDAEPMLYLQTILTRTGGASADPQRNLHSDAFHPSVKAWLFLTDVAEDRAAFQYVPGSHRLTAERRAWERDMSILAARSPDRLTRRGSFRIDPASLPQLGLPEPRTFAVAANTLVVADMFGFHARGPSGVPAMRVEIWAFGRHNPFTPWTKLRLWNISAIARRRAALFWLYGDLAERLGFGRSVWRRQRNSSAFDASSPVNPD
jgi:hypothetical protein